MLQLFGKCLIEHVGVSRCQILSSAHAVHDPDPQPGDTQLVMIPESSLAKDHYGIAVESGAPLSRHFNQSSLPLHRNNNVQSAFCTQQNVQECLSHISQEVSSLGLSTVWTELDESSDLNVVTVLNCMYDLIQLHRRSLRTLENMEVEQLKSSSKLDYLQLSTTRLKEQLECSKRENIGLLERERQLQQKVKSLQNCLKNEKEEVQKLQNIIASRATQYSHDMKRKERDLNKLKEQLNQLLADKKERKQAIDILNNIGRADGKRSVWKTEKTEAKHEGEMYRTLLSDYDARQRDLVLENAELRKVLQQMKNDMVSLLRLKKLTLKGVQHERNGTQAYSEEEEEEGFDLSKELFCVHACEKLTNNIRLQWRRLKCHVEQLDSQVLLAQVNAGKNSETIPREAHEEEMDKLKQEIQQCKDLIQAQQHLLQRQLSSSCEEIASLQNDGYMLQEKECLRGEWKTLEEQKSIFERERKNFTEAAIRLSHEVKQNGNLLLNQEKLTEIPSESASTPKSKIRLLQFTFNSGPTSCSSHDSRKSTWESRNRCEDTPTLQELWNHEKNLSNQSSTQKKNKSL